jgi:tetratricopeptide (TPR) repeat protein
MKQGMRAIFEHAEVMAFFRGKGMGRMWQWTVGGVVVLLTGCASTPAQVKPDVRVEAAVPAAGGAGDADVGRVIDGVHMIQAGHIQAAIDGPFDEVVHRYESRYGSSKEKIYSARGMTDTLLYAAMSATAKPPIPAQVIGPAWAMAYWGRGYAYNEMARYDDATVELRKALALAPDDTQYNIELGFTYQRKGQWETSLELFKTAEAYAEITVPAAEVADLTCKALRGQGYDLVEMHRYGEARAAYKACLKQIPGEPKSIGELKYIDQVEAKQRAGTQESKAEGNGIAHGFSGSMGK